MILRTPAFALALLFMTTPSMGAVVSFEYTSTIPLSYDPNTNVSIVYSFDDAALPISTVNHPDGEGSYSIYGNVGGTASIGLDSLSFSDATIWVYNDWASFSADIYHLLIGESFGATISGTVDGFEVIELGFALEFPDLLTDTSLVSSLIVLNSYIHNDLALWGPDFQIRSSSGAAAISAVPLPAALPLYATGVGLMGLFGWWRRRKAAARLQA